MPEGPQVELLYLSLITFLPHSLYYLIKYKPSSFSSTNTYSQLIIVCTIYLPPNDHIEQYDLNNLTMQLPSPFVKEIPRGWQTLYRDQVPQVDNWPQTYNPTQPSPFVCLVTLIVHNPLWRSPDINPRRQVIEDFIMNNCLCILKNGKNTYFHEPFKTFYAIACLPTYAFSATRTTH